MHQTQPSKHPSPSEDSIAQLLCKEYDGPNLLFNAIHQNNLVELKRLLAENYPINSASNIGVAALTAACRYGRIELIDQLITADADLNAVHNPTSGYDFEYGVNSPLNAAFAYGDVALIKKLMNRGAIFTPSVEFLSYFCTLGKLEALDFYLELVGDLKISRHNCK